MIGQQVQCCRTLAGNRHPVFEDPATAECCPLEFATYRAVASRLLCITGCAVALTRKPAAGVAAFTASSVASADSCLSWDQLQFSRPLWNLQMLGTHLLGTRWLVAAEIRHLVRCDEHSVAEQLIGSWAALW